MQQLFSLMSLKYVCCYWFLVWICKVKAFLTGIKCWVGRVCYFLEWKFSSYVTELVRRLLKARTKVLDSHDNQVLRVDSKLLNYFRPFQFDESRRNCEKQEPRLSTWFSILARIKNRVSTYFWTRASRNHDKPVSGNYPGTITLLTNGT